MRKRFLGLTRRIVRHPAKLALATVLGFLLLVNGSIRVIGGGEPFLFSPSFMKEKLQALALLVQHAPRHYFGSCRHSRTKQIYAAARKHHVPANFLMAVAKNESAFKPHRISHAGAMGVMQLMPYTADDLRVRDPFDAQQNIDGGAKFIRYLWKRYPGAPDRVAAAYHAGPGAVARKGPIKVGPATKIYMKRVTAEYRKLSKKR